MTAAIPTRRPRAARSTKVRPEVAPVVDGARLGSFPPPTAHSEQLALDNLQLAKMMANRMATATRMPFDDLYLVAAKGLLNGCRRYDPERLNPSTGRPFALSTAVVPFIRGAMAQWLRDRGHSSGVRFPDRWRDHAPRVRRLAGEGATMEAVCAATGLPPSDVEAILQAQATTSLLDPDCFRRDAPEGDPLDEAEAFDALADALVIADQAHAALRWADRQMLEAAWDVPRRRQLARLPHGQFLRQVEGIIRGRRPRPAEEQQDLSLELPEGPADAAGQGSGRRRLVDPVEILQAAEQLALFDACPDPDGGKTAPAGKESGGAAADQPSIRSGQSAVVSASEAGRAPRRSGAGR